MAATKYAFCAGASEHGVSKVRADNVRFAAIAKGESEIAGAAAEVEDESVRAREDGAEKFGSAGAPEAVEIDGKNVVERVVGGRDAREHFADFLRGVGFGSRALRAGAEGGVSGHG